MKTLSLLPFMAFAVATPVLAQDQAAPTETAAIADQVIVNGMGEARGAPDLAVTTLTVLRTGETARAALDDANEAAGAVAAAMREFGIEDADLQTGNLTVAPQYRFENRADGTTVPPQIIGYEVRNSLTVRVRDLDRLGEILDRAIDEGVNEGGDIRFLIEDPAELENAARTRAFERARSSAEALASAAGRTLGSATLIADEMSGFTPPQPMPMARSMMAAEASGVPVQIGENTVEAHVRVIFELGDETR